MGRVQGSDAQRPLGFGPTVSSVAKPAVPHVLMTASDSAPRRPVGRRGRPSRHAWGALALVAAAAASLSSAPGAGARRAHRARVRPVILDARCLPPGKCEPDGRHVERLGHLVFRGQHLGSGMLVVFRAQAKGPGRPTSTSAHLRRSKTHGLIVTVPTRAVSGHIVAVSRRGVRSLPFGPIYVIRHLGRRPATGVTKPSHSAFDGAGMWIWYLSKSNGGNLSAIVAKARAAGIKTLYVKSSDGSSNYWSQFSSDTVAALKAQGLKVCAWQYVYGTHPIGEADLGARAVTAGADCLVIDAESEYEGHYAAAQRYMTELRAKVGAAYPIGLASFPYVDYHPSLPYSVFLGPQGAQYNAPQMYWKDIGTTVDTVYAHTFVQNRVYDRPIFPLGQTYQDPAPSQIHRFRALAAAYGFAGLSWWDWQETSARGWASLGDPVAPVTGFTVPTSWPTLRRGAKGDQVVWMQEHLASVAPSTPTNGTFDSTTDSALRAFQSDRHLPVSGATDPATWQALLALTPVVVDWTGSSATSASARSAGARSASARSARARSAAGRRVRRQAAPASARLPARAYEIPRVG